MELLGWKRNYFQQSVGRQVGRWEKQGREGLLVLPDSHCGRWVGRLTPGQGEGRADHCRREGRADHCLLNIHAHFQ